MKKPEEEHLVPLAEVKPFDAVDLVAAMATILNNALHNYWLSSADYRQAVSDCFDIVNRILKGCSEISFRVANKTLAINGKPLERKTPRIQMFINHLESLEVYNCSLMSGITFDDFMKLVEIIGARPEEIKQLGGFPDLIAKFEIQHVKAKKTLLKEVAESEIVVSKEELEKGAGAAAGGAGEERVGSILAFLKGEMSLGDKTAVKNFNETASDPAAMADLILRAAEVRQKSANVEGGETLVDFVVGCLRRTYEGMTQDPAFKTKSGKKKITKNLLLLEKEIVDKMREMAGEWDDEALSKIAAVAEEMTDELKMDAMADEYVSKHKAIEESEERLLKFMNAPGKADIAESSLREKLLDKGLSLGDWRELVIKSGSGLGGGAGAGGYPGTGAEIVSETIGRLDMLLDRMEKQFAEGDKEAAQANADKLVKILVDLTLRVRNMANATKRDIRELIDNIKSDQEAVESAEQEAEKAGKSFRLKRTQMLAAFAKILEDVAEPVSLIQSALDMLDSRALGGLGEVQAAALRVAAENTATARVLIQDLARICPGSEGKTATKSNAGGSAGASPSTV